MNSPRAFPRSDAPPDLSSASASVRARPAGLSALEASGKWTVAYLGFQVLYWGVYVAVGLWSTVRAIGPQPAVIGGYVLFFFYSIAITHALRRWAQRRDWLSLSPVRAALRFLLATLAVGTLLTVLVLAVQSIWTQTSPFAWPAVQLVGLLVSTTISTFVCVAVYVGAASLMRARWARQNAVQLELDMREAKLKALEAQIGPHFLFNCLNMLRGMIVENPTAAQDIVTRLANILRHNLSRDVRPTETLQTQLDVTMDYLALEALRFEERLRSHFDVAPNLLEAEMPAMLLQTLVENAVKHGISHLPEGGEIRIACHAPSDTRIELVVENTGTLRASPPESTRVGLRNVRERMRVLHGEHATLTLNETAAGTVRATATLPYKTRAV